jgi:ribosome-associated translation inhibitor RaiA
MRIRVSATSNSLDPKEIDAIERDFEKIDRRLQDLDEVTAEVRVDDAHGNPGYHVTAELHYRRNHLIAKTDHTELGQAVRAAREDLLRQINDRSRGGHSSFAKKR